MFQYIYIYKSPNWPQIPDHRYKILIIGESGSGKANSLLNLINHQPNIDKMYLYAKNTHEAKYQLLIEKLEGARLKNLNGSKVFIEYSNDLADV